MGGGPVVDERGRPEGHLYRCGAVAARTRCAAAGVATLARLITNVREETTQRLWKMLESLLTAGQRIHHITCSVRSAQRARRRGPGREEVGLGSPGSEPAHRGAGARLLALDSAVGRRCQPGVASDPLDEREKQEAVVAFRHGLEEQCQRWLPEGC
jgi:hypothetical protein